MNEWPVLLWKICQMQVRIDVCAPEAVVLIQVGVLTRHILDDGRGFARSKVFKHGHEEATGRTSSIGQHNLCVSKLSWLSCVVCPYLPCSHLLFLLVVLVLQCLKHLRMTHYVLVLVCVASDLHCSSLDCAF